jgi:hypothetical protein
MIWLLRALALFGPALLLLLAGLFEPVAPTVVAVPVGEGTALPPGVSGPPSSARFPLLVGAAALAIVGLALLAYFRTLAVPISSAALVTHGLALVWQLLMVPSLESRLRAGVLDYATESWFAAVTVVLLTQHWMVRSGAIIFRRARLLSQKIAQKEDWPSDLNACRDLPITRQFREAIVFDASPAIELLSHRRPEVRMVALTALEFRTNWRPGQIDQLLNYVQGETVPIVRIAAINAVANVDERRPTELLAEALHDHDPRVRQAASDALFWDNRRPWDWIRNGIRATLADPKLHDCGSLLREGQTLPKEGVQSLLAWAAERGQVGVRAAQTLAVYYVRALLERPEEVCDDLMRCVLDPQAPPILRINFARLLARHNRIHPQTLERLLDASNPAPLRLMASELLLSTGYSSNAVTCLREVSKLPNRELALDTARIVQQFLNVDMGLAVGQPLPPAGSPKAAEIARRLTIWAAKSESGESALDTNYRPAGF